MLAKNPGLPLDATVWPYIGYKGGSEPGVLDMTFLLRRADDKWFVVTATANTDEGGTVDQEPFFAIVNGLVQLIAVEK